MLNIQKYANEILSEYKNTSCDYMTDGDFYHTLYNVAREHNKEVHDNWSLKSLLNWFLEEYKEPILTDEEKEYLITIIKPFRDRVKCICRRGATWNYICIFYEGKNNENFEITIPVFVDGKEDEGYKGMEINKTYKLTELGL